MTVKQQACAHNLPERLSSVELCTRENKACLRNYFTRYTGKKESQTELYFKLQKTQLHRILPR